MLEDAISGDDWFEARKETTQDAAAPHISVHGIGYSSQIAKFMGPIWGRILAPCRPHWTLLSGLLYILASVTPCANPSSTIPDSVVRTRRPWKQLPIVAIAFNVVLMYPRNSINLWNVCRCFHISFTTLSYQTWWNTHTAYSRFWVSEITFDLGSRILLSYRSEHWLVVDIRFRLKPHPHTAAVGCWILSSLGSYYTPHGIS